MLERTIKPIAVAVGTVFAAALATAAVAEADSVFAVDELDRGYDRLADGDGDGEEGSCGEGKCGEGDGEGDGDGDGDGDGEAEAEAEAEAEGEAEEAAEMEEAADA